MDPIEAKRAEYQNEQDPTRRMQIRRELDQLEGRGNEAAATLTAIANSAFLNIPDFVASVTDNENYKKIQRERAALPDSTKLGAELGGALVSAPTGGILKGAGALFNLGKSVPALSKIGTGLTRAGQALASPSKNMGTALLKGAGAGLEQAIPRIGFKAGADREFDPLAALGEAGLAAGAGGLMGAGFKGIGNIFKPKTAEQVASKSGLKDVVEDAADSLAMAGIQARGIDNRALRQLRTKYMGAGGSARKLEKWEKIRADLQKMGDEWDMGKAGSDRRVVEWNNNLQERFAPVDEYFEKNKLDLKNFMEKAKDKSDWGETYTALKKMDPVTTNRIGTEISTGLDSIPNLTGKRQYLQMQINAASKGTTLKDQVRYQTALAMKSALDDKLDEAMELSGNEKFKDLLNEWKIKEMYADSHLRGEMAMGNAGSQTQQSQNLEGLVTGKKSVGDFAGGLVGALGKPVQNAVSNRINMMAGGLAEPVRNLAGIIPDNIILPKVVQKAGEFVGRRPGALGAAAAQNIVDNDSGQAIEAGPLASPDVPNTEGTKEAPKPKQHSQAYLDKLSPGLVNLYHKSGAAKQGASFQEFAEYVRTQTNDFNPKRVAGLIYKDKAERQKFIRDLDRAEQIKKVDIKKALKKEGLDYLGLGGNEERSNLINALASMTASNSDLGDEKAQKNIEQFVKKIMDLPEEKRTAALYEALQNKDILNWKQLQEMGVV